jgi:hypothetical protein
LNVSFIACFQVISNRLWAHTKQEKGHCIKTRSTQGFNLYNIEKENPFEGRLLVYKVAKRVVVFPNEWEVWKISSKCCKFFKCGKFVLQVFENS